MHLVKNVLQADTEQTVVRIGTFKLDRKTEEEKG
jgi:hypothetical protein